MCSIVRRSSSTSCCCDVAFGLELLGDAAALILGLFAANFELLGLAGKPLFELLRTAAAASELLGVVLHFGLSSPERLLILGQFVRAASSSSCLRDNASCC